MSLLASSCLSVRMDHLGSHWTDFHEIRYLSVFQRFENFQDSLTFVKNNGYFTWRPILILIRSRSFLLRLRNILDTCCEENRNTNFVFNNFFFSEKRAVYKIMWKNIVELDRPKKTIWCMRISRWVPEATNTCSEYVIVIAFPQQQWLHERATV
jgi:hypothetical protein